jgi:hypothetical protein
MVKVLAGVLVVSALAGCSSLTAQQDVCSQNPAGYDCQIERYQKAPD